MSLTISSVTGLAPAPATVWVLGGPKLPTLTGLCCTASSRGCVSAAPASAASVSVSSAVSRVSILY